MAAPLRSRDFTVELIANFDDVALGVFLDPKDGGIDPESLGVALQHGDSALTARVAEALPAPARARFLLALDTPHDEKAVATSRLDVLDQLFWPLIYWNWPDEYEELVSGERIDDRVLDVLDLEGRIVCDIGAGAGRFALPAAARARTVIAVDAVPPLLQRLEAKVRDAGLDNVEVRRGSFSDLPLDDAGVDIAVACSSFTPSGPHGGARALLEAERIVRPGGEVAIIWPKEPDWFRSHGYAYLGLHSDDVMHFRDVATAHRLCADYYSERAARWVRRYRCAEVPYRVLGTTPPSDVCLKRMADQDRLL